MTADLVLASELAAELGEGFALLCGEDALARLSHMRPEIALLDVHLAGRMSGVDVLRHIRKNLPGVF